MTTKATPNPVRVEVFRAHYATALAAAVAANPVEYAISTARVPEVATRMTAALAIKNANLSPTTQKACRALGIPHKINAIAAWLCDTAPLGEKTAENSAEG